MTAITNESKAQPRVRRIYRAREKAQAVLSLWSGRRVASRICRDLRISWGMLNSWERKAIRGMLKGLGSESEPGRAAGELGPRMEGLLLGLLVPEREMGERDKLGKKGEMELPQAE
jgi:transposase-like protein